MTTIFSYLDMPISLMAILISFMDMKKIILVVKLVVAIKTQFAIKMNKDQIRNHYKQGRYAGASDAHISGYVKERFGDN
mgnify:CR=1 FL=1